MASQRTYSNLAVRSHQASRSNSFPLCVELGDVQGHLAAIALGAGGVSEGHTPHAPSHSSPNRSPLSDRGSVKSTSESGMRPR
jgi:hypothetical protein